MTNAKIDSNSVKTWLAYNETTGDIEPVLVDPITGALMIYATAIILTPPTALNNAKIDENDVKTLLGYNETMGLVEALRCSTTGDLLINN